VKTKRCPDCDGYGTAEEGEEPKDEIPCHLCQGTGEIDRGPMPDFVGKGGF